MYTLYVLHPGYEDSLTHYHAPDLRALISTALGVFVHPHVTSVAIANERHDVLFWLDVDCEHPVTGKGW